MPKKICKPNGRAIWPKFWKDVKFIMTEAKAWNFEELENGNIKVWEFELEVWDFEIVLEWTNQNKNTNEAMESGFWTAVAISTELTPELISEWLARDIVRQIQEARKQAQFEVDDRIQVSITWENISKVLENFKEYIENETLSSIVENLENPDLEKEIDIEWNKIVLSLKK
jgi:isoleucyl-tRNA synthetase